MLKNSAFQVNKVKIRGFTTSYAMSSQLNRESLEEKVTAFVKENVVDTTTVVRQNIRRTDKNEVITVTKGKTYKVVCDKRVVNPDYTTHPFGTCM